MVNSATDPVILVVSRDADFATPLAEQVMNELLLPCKIAENFDSLPSSVALVVTNEATAEYSVAVLRVKQPPFKMQELLQDIASARQKQLGEDMGIGTSYRLQPRQKKLVYVPTDQAVSLTDKEVKLVQCLAEAGIHSVSKEHLLKQVWDMDAALETHTLETHIYRLRAKFRELGGDEMVIAEGGGYKLEAI